MKRIPLLRRCGNSAKLVIAALAGALFAGTLASRVHAPSSVRTDAGAGAGVALAQSITTNEPLLQTVDRDTWLTTNARHNGGAWVAEDAARPSFALWMNDRGAIPFEGNLGGAGFWVHRAGCSGAFGPFAQQCGWNLGLVATEDKSVIVGGNAIEVDGNGSLPYGRLLNTSDGSSHYVGIATNVFGDFSGVDKADQPSWLAAVNLTDDSFDVMRRGRRQKGPFEPMLAVKRSGDVVVAGAVISTRAEQRGSDQWATRGRLKNGRFVFVFTRPFATVPVCVATSEDLETGPVHSRPTRGSCTVISDRPASSYVDVVIVGNPN